MNDVVETVVYGDMTFELRARNGDAAEAQVGPVLLKRYGSPGGPSYMAILAVPRMVSAKFGAYGDEPKIDGRRANSAVGALHGLRHELRAISEWLAGLPSSLRGGAQ